MKTLVLGLGNPILSDDSVGIKAAQEIGKRLNNPQITVAETSAAGLSLLDSIAGYDKAIIIDAVQTKNGKAGQIYRMGPEDFSYTKRFSSPHQINLITALEVGKMLGLVMPQKITIFAVEAKNVTNFGEQCTPKVEQAIPKVVEMVLQELNAENP
ncbi:MAG: hydrogenase maturation protease [Chloroflexi bacterium]|nr:hydrogenase maturation protease [Chloroflexota bacterium]